MGLSAGLGVFSDHSDATSATFPMDFVHIGLDEHDAAAVEAFNVFVGSGIGYAGALEACALIFDDDFGGLWGDGSFDADGFFGVELVSVFDGVNESFFEGEADGEGSIWAIMSS